MKAHENVLLTKTTTTTTVKPGVFRCSPHGVRVEVFRTHTGASVSIRVGDERNDRQLIDRHTAGVLRDFFADLADYI